MNAIIRHLTSLALAGMVAIVAAVIFQTFWPHTAPVIIDAQNVRVERDASSVVLQWDCRSRIVRSIKGHTVRSLVRDGHGGEIIALPTTEFNFVAGASVPMVKSFVLPSALAPGRWCMQSQLHWYEPMALRESIMQGVSACFDVPPAPIMSDAAIRDRLHELERILADHTRADFEQHADILRGNKPN